MLKKVLPFLGVIIAGLIAGIIGLIAGMLIGGNYLTTFEFNDVRGYEATGQLGFLIGASAGLLTGYRMLLKK